jgi:hypothetical protein
MQQGGTPTSPPTKQNTHLSPETAKNPLQITSLHSMLPLHPLKKKPLHRRKMMMKSIFSEATMRMMLKQNE